MVVKDVHLSSEKPVILLHGRDAARVFSSNLAIKLLQKHDIQAIPTSAVFGGCKKEPGPHAIRKAVMDGRIKRPGTLEPLKISFIYDISFGKDLSVLYHPAHEIDGQLMASVLNRKLEVAGVRLRLHDERIVSANGSLHDLAKDIYAHLFKMSISRPIVKQMVANIDAALSSFKESNGYESIFEAVQGALGPFNTAKGVPPECMLKIYDAIRPLTEKYELGVLLHAHTPALAVIVPGYTVRRMDTLIAASAESICEFEALRPLGTNPERA